MRNKPIVLISSYPPRLCGIATFCEEAREFIQKANPQREVLVISHTDGEGHGVLPIIDPRQSNWWKPVAEKVKELDPYVIHIQHEYGLYEHCDSRGIGDGNDGFLDLLEAIEEYPIVVELHTVHGRLSDFEADFIFKVCQRSHVALFKCHYQKWRLDWNFRCREWPIPQNIMVVPHGARPDKQWKDEEIPRLRKDLRLDELGMAENIVGMVGWIQSNKRWDILLNMWEEIHKTLKMQTGKDWNLLAAGTMRDPAHRNDYEVWTQELRHLERKGIAHYREFIPRGEEYYKMIAICDFVVLPTVDETQSGTLARIIAVNRPYITTAPMEGLTAQTLESEGGLLFTNKKMLKEKILCLASNDELRQRLRNKLKHYLENIVSWEVIAKQYNEAYELASEAVKTGKPVQLESEF